MTEQDDDGYCLDGDGYCGECKKKLTEKNRYSDWTCKDCAKELGT